MQDARAQTATTRSGQTPSLAVLFVLLSVLAVVTPSCADPASALADANESRLAGEFAREREILRAALESSPDDVPLLMAAARYYLRAEPEGRYKPRLALHYAMRASRQPHSSDPAVSALLFTAYRAAGGSDEGRELVQRGLEAVGHPDAANPVSLQAVDPDLVEPTLRNLIEQRRRWSEGPQPACPPGTGHIAAGRYPVGPSGEREVAGFCIDVLAAGELATQMDTLADLESACGLRDRRVCSSDELLVGCTAMRAVLGQHPACTKDRILRCCLAARPIHGQPLASTPGVQ